MFFVLMKFWDIFWKGCLVVVFFDSWNLKGRGIGMNVVMRFVVLRVVFWRICFDLFISDRLREGRFKCFFSGIMRLMVVF